MNYLNHVLLQKHKGIKRLELDGLGNINIIFGKNNSGKTSILESLVSDKNCGFIIDLNSPDFLELIGNEASLYLSSLEKKINTNIRLFAEQTEGLYFSNASDIFISQFMNFISKDRALNRLNDLINFEELLQTYHTFLARKYSRVLIPPKRFLESETVVNSAIRIQPDGRGIVNRLFYLKNGEAQSNEQNIFTQIYSAFKSICSYDFDIILTDKNELILKFKRAGDEKWIQASDSGLGLSDLLVMITFTLDSQEQVLCIEEPESHLHPEIQNKFLNFINTVKNKQFVITTHSPVFLNPAIADSIFYTLFNDKEIVVSNETDKADVLFNLGFSIADYLIADAIILCDNATDIPVLMQIFNMLELDRYFNIYILPISGDLKAYMDMSLYKNRKRVYSISFSDDRNRIKYERFEKKCRAVGIETYTLSKISIENYFSFRAIKKVLKENIPSDFLIVKDDLSLDAQLGFSLIGKSVKLYNNAIIRGMNLEELEGTDLMDFCKVVKKDLLKNEEGDHFNNQLIG